MHTHQVRTKPAVLSQLAWRNYCKRSLHLVAQLFIKSIPKHSCLLNSPNRPTLFINRLDYLIIISAQTPSGWNFWSDYQDTIVENGEILAQWMSQCTEKSLSKGRKNQIRLDYQGLYGYWKCSTPLSKCHKPESRCWLTHTRSGGSQIKVANVNYIR